MFSSNQQLHVWAKARTNCDLIYSMIHQSVARCNPFLSQQVRLNSSGNPPLCPCPRINDLHYNGAIK